MLLTGSKRKLKLKLSKKSLFENSTFEFISHLFLRIPIPNQIIVQTTPRLLLARFFLLNTDTICSWETCWT